MQVPMAVTSLDGEGYVQPVSIWGDFGFPYIVNVYFWFFGVWQMVILISCKTVNCDFVRTESYILHKCKCAF